MALPGTTILGTVLILWSCVIGFTRNEISTPLSFEGGEDFTQLKYFPDISRSEIFVGGVDAVYRLNLSDFSVIEKVSWSSSSDQVAKCLSKGTGPSQCRNYLTIMLRGPADTILTCGSQAMGDGECVYRRAGNLSQIAGISGGPLKTPKSKHDPIAAFITSSGDQFFGSNYGTFTNRKPVFSRHSSAKPNLLRTPDVGKNWLNEAEFVEIFDSDPFIYVLFREEAVEFLEKQSEKRPPIISRIGRVCQNDVGDVFGTKKDRWTTFQKARLECPSFPSADPSSDKGTAPSFLFDQLQQAVVLGSNRALAGKTIAGIFNGPGDSLYGAAICLYDMDAAQRVFQGSYQHQPQLNSTWLRARNDLPRFNCEVDPQRRNASIRDQDMNNYLLMYDSVQPRFRRAVVVEQMTLFRLLVAEEIELGNNPSAIIFYVLTDQKDIRKYVLDTSANSTKEACLVHVWSTLFEPREDVLTMTLIAEENVLVVGTLTRVIRISTATCGRYTSQGECVSSGDPHCGWNTEHGVCTEYLLGRPSVENIVPAALGACSIDSYLQPWNSSSWTPCTNEQSNEKCMCRQRECRSYKCSQLGERTVQVINCTRNGGWTEFSEWGQCDGSCEHGRRVRRRTCSNPAPQFGGLDCPGDTNETEPCNPFGCAVQRLRSFVPVGAASIGSSQLQDWGPWGQCSRPCGGGVQRRTRACMSSTAGAPCDGPQTEVRECGMEPCPPFKRVTEWTAWISAGTVNQNTAVEPTTPGGFQEHRYSCVGVFDAAKMLDDDQNDALEVTIKHEERFCETAGSCHTNQHYDNILKASWTAWSACDDTALQYRHQNCQGIQQRVCPSNAKGARSTADAENPWACWTDWSLCQNGVQTREHACLFDSKTCSPGEKQSEERPCNNEALIAASSMAPPIVSWVYLVLSCVISFFAGMGVVGSVIFFRRRHESSAIQQRQLAQQNMYTAAAGKPLMNGNGGHYSQVSLNGMIKPPAEDYVGEDTSFVPERSVPSHTDRPLSRHFSTRSNGVGSANRQDSVRHKVKTDDSMYS